MKSACTVLMMLLMGIFGVQAQTVVFSENFDAFDGATGTNISSSLDSYTSMPGWTGSKVYRYSGKAKMGSSSELGWLQTPAIDLSGGNGNFILEFDATAWLNDSTFIKVYVDNTLYTVSGLDNSSDYDNLNHYTLPLSGGTSATHIKFEGAQAAKGRFFIDNLTITVSGGTPIAAQPTFSSPTGLYTAPISLTISSETPNASIYYTLDGSTPTTSSTPYTAPFTINQTTTVKAIATASGYNNSSVASATYTFPTTVATIADFKAQTSDDMVTIANDVTYVFGSGAYTYVKDASGGLLIYGNGITTEFSEGDQISGLTGKKSVFSDQVEMQYVVNPAPATSNTGMVTPVVVTVSDLLANYDSYDAQLVTIENVSFPDGFEGLQQTTFTQNGSSMVLYNRFGLDTTLSANATVNITGFAAIHNGNVQICPRYNHDLGTQAPVQAPSLTVTSPTNGAVYSTLDTLHIGLSVQNFVLGTDGYIKVESSFLEAMGFGEFNPIYIDQNIYGMIAMLPLSPLPAGTYSFTATLVGMDSVAITPAVSITSSFSVVAPVLDAPVFTPGSGTYADSVTFSLTCTTSDAQIRYTTDGTAPTETSTLYSAPVTLTASDTVNAKAFKTNWNSSETATAVYTVVYNPVLAIDATALDFNSTQLSQTLTVSGAHLTSPITLTCNDPHFTVNPDSITNPNNNTPVTVVFDGTAPATGILTITSDTLTAQVILTATAQLPAPVLTPATATDTMVTVTMSCTVADASIRYTTDGSEPTAQSALYIAPVVLDTPGTYTVKAVAMKSDWETSSITSGTYTIQATTVVDTIIYTVGFEDNEGFTASNVYNNNTVIYTGADGQLWGTYYGTPSTNNHIAGAQSMQMRWYASNADNLGYTFTNFDLPNVTHVAFKASCSNGLKVNVSHSIDGGSSYSAGETFPVTSSAQTYEYVVNENGAYDYVRLRFTIVLPETTPTATSRLVIDSVVVYGVPGVSPSTVSAPVITPNEGFYYEPQTVSITCTDAEAVIRYTTDGTTPTENSPVYSTPFSVTSTTTVKAKAWKAGMTPSFVSTVTISFPEQVANIATFKANASGTAQQIMSDVTFLFRSGSYMFVEDNSAALLIYDNSGVITTEYNEGDVIESGLFGSYQLYNGMVELIPSHNAATATGTPVTVMPTVATVANVKNQYANVYESKLVRIENVEFIDDVTFVQNGDTMAIRDRFNSLSTEITAGVHADVVGFVSYSNNYGYQIYPRDNGDILIHTVETVATPVFDVYRDGEFYRVHIACTTEDASIYYTFDGTDPDETSNLFTSDFPLNIQPYTLKAIAMKEGMTNSEIAVYSYNPSSVNSFVLSRQLQVYPNPCVNQVVVSAQDGVTIEKVELYNSYGQLLYRVEANASEAVLSVATIATGTYYAKVFTNAGIATMPVVRQ